ncbi:hypothetical protein D9757_014214 [Collybiopsis confluens]|uniref:Uncharacterized protein n=1 Tax=Collybiopsis confluens TaxID=2823264 RepID=A0A8H5CYA2_9AGAR|nr:hypothetical protein D9757_014214 [Collybiopsis confluens]
MQSPGGYSGDEYSSDKAYLTASFPFPFPCMSRRDGYPHHAHIEVEKQGHVAVALAAAVLAPVTVDLVQEHDEHDFDDKGGTLAIHTHASEENGVRKPGGPALRTAVLNLIFFSFGFFVSFFVLVLVFVLGGRDTTLLSSSSCSSSASSCSTYMSCLASPWSESWSIASAPSLLS